MKPAAALAAVQEAPCINLCPVISETSGWVPAAYHQVARPDITCLSAAARVQPRQLSADRFEGDSPLLAALAQARAAEHQLDASAQPNAAVWSVSTGIASFPFLT